MPETSEGTDPTGTESTGTECRIEFTANVTGPGETRTLMGREVRVVPATLVRSQVLHNNLGACFLAAEDITPVWAEMANGSPVIIDHPTRRGQPISAREPGVLNERGTGWVFNARAQDGTLKADVFLEEGRAKEVAELAAILEKLDAGEAVELSTGFPGQAEAVEDGVHNGESFDLRIRPTGFDHLAIFADKVGACSLEDGCGLGVRNCGCGQHEEADPARNLASRIWEHLRSLVGAENQESEFSLDDLRQAVREALEVSFGADNRFVFIVELFEDSVVYGIDEQGEEDRLFRADYTVDEEAREVTLGEPEEVEKIVEFVPVENEDGTTSIQVRHEYLAINETPEGSNDMKREEIIAQLVENERVAFRRETLEAMNDEELAHVATAANEAEDDPADADGPAAEEAPEADAKDADAANEDDTEPPAWAKTLLERMDRVEESTEPARNQAAEDRKRLTSDIVANSEYEADELKGKPLAELRKLHQALVRNSRPRNYVGLGGPRAPDPTNRKLSFDVYSVSGAGPGKPLSDKPRKEAN